MDDNLGALKQALEQFHDFVAPRLDTYEQAIYLYAFRHSLLIEWQRREVVIGFKSARRKMAMGIGEAGKPMSEATCYRKLQSLADKGCLEILDSTRSGTKLRIRLPSEIPGLIPAADMSAPADPDYFFSDPEGRAQIFARESNRCFYCHKELDPTNRLIEHVRSRPEGDSSYRNVVAACRGCNNRKGEMSATDFIRTLYRSGLLSEEDVEGRVKALTLLQNGDLKPIMDDT